MPSCRFCKTGILSHAHRTLRQKLTMSAVYRCRACGQYGYTFRFPPGLSSWSDDCLQGHWLETRKVSLRKIIRGEA